MNARRPLLLLISCLAGCVAAPIPQVATFTDEFGYRTGPVAAAINGHRLPDTSRDDVLMTFGEPDCVTDDERGFVYLCQKKQGNWIGGGISPEIYPPIPYGIAAPYGEDVEVFFEFDELGGVVRSEIMREKGTSAGLRLEAWPYASSEADLRKWMNREIGRDVPKQAG